MAVIHKVTCDGCERDLTTTGNCEGHRLVLRSEPISVRSGPLAAVVFVRPLDQTHHFCGLACLWKWAANAVKRQERREADDQEGPLFVLEAEHDVSHPAWWTNSGN